MDMTMIAYVIVCLCTSCAHLLLDVSTTSTGTWILGTLWGDSQSFPGTTFSWASSSSKSCCHKIRFFKSTVHSNLQNHWQWHECDLVSMCTQIWAWPCLYMSLYACVCSCTSYAHLLLDVNATSTGTWILDTFGETASQRQTQRGRGQLETGTEIGADRDSLTDKHRVKPLMFLYTNLWLHGTFQPLKLYTVGVSILLSPFHVL